VSRNYIKRVIEEIAELLGKDRDKKELKSYLQSVANTYGIDGQSPEKLKTELIYAAITRNSNSIDGKDGKIPYQMLSAETLTIHSIINRAYEGRTPEGARTLALNPELQEILKIGGDGVVERIIETIRSCCNESNVDLQVAEGIIHEAYDTIQEILEKHRISEKEYELCSPAEQIMIKSEINRKLSKIL